METADLRFVDHGTIWMVTAETEEGRTWLTDAVSHEPWQWLGPSLAVDHRMAPGLASFAEADGLRVALG